MAADAPREARGWSEQRDGRANAEGERGRLAQNPKKRKNKLSKK
jgi:hypothetical protein